MLYKFFLILLTCLLISAPAFCAKSLVTPVDAQRAAQSHNNKGVDFYNDKDYMAAIKEFKIALGINPNNQTSAVYHNNLGRTYLALARLGAQGAPFAYWAQVSFESAIAQDCMNLGFYKNLVDSFALQGNMGERLTYYSKDTSKNPFSSIVVALIYERQGNRQAAAALLSDFVKTFPDLIITNDIKKHLRE